LLSVATAHANVTPFVDYDKTNASANKTTDVNAALELLGSYSRIWNIGDAWSTGFPATVGATIFAENIQYVVDVTTAHTEAQVIESYRFNCSDQSYSAITGLGDLAASYRTSALPPTPRSRKPSRSRPCTPSITTLATGRPHLARQLFLNIPGIGGLIKQGSGMLVLTGGRIPSPASYRWRAAP